LIAALSFLAGLYLPWWSIAIVSFIVTLCIRQSIGIGFLSGFLGVFLLWTILSFWIDLNNDHILSSKIARIFPLGGSSALLIIVTAFTGAIVGGFAGMAGSSIHRQGRLKR
jgi:hypothetical protein